MKLTIVGQGTAGLMGAAHFWKWTDWEIEVIGDPTIPPVTVGEGSQMALPILLNEAFRMIQLGMQIQIPRPLEKTLFV